MLYLRSRGSSDYHWYRRTHGVVTERFGSSPTGDRGLDFGEVPANGIGRESPGKPGIQMICGVTRGTNVATLGQNGLRLPINSASAESFVVGEGGGLGFCLSELKRDTDSSTLTGVRR